MAPSILTERLLSQASKLSPWQKLALVVVTAVLINILLTVKNIVYNIYFHPLRKYPGPQLWIAFPILRNIAQIRGNSEFKIRGFHEKYGPVVRCGANELMFTSASAWKDIYGHGHAELQKYYPAGTRPDGVQSLLFVSSSQDHFRSRRAMLPAFSDKALAEQEPLIQVYVELLVEKLKGMAVAKKPTDMVKWYTLTTFDLIGDLAYGESFDGLESGKSNEWLDNIDKMMKFFPIIVLVFSSPIISKTLLYFFGGVLKKPMREHEELARDLTMKRINNKDLDRRGDFMDFIMRSRGEKHALTNEEMAANSDTLILAGSETTATLLSGVTYYLLRSPEVLKRCLDEVRDAFETREDITFKSASTKLPYMLACFNEALRIFPPVPIALTRITNLGISTPIAGHDIPGNVRVGVHHLAAYHSSINFHRAKEFLPERWLPEAATDPDSPFYNDQRDVHKPFSFGPRDCIGRNLAYHEMRLILANVLWSYDLTLLHGNQEWAENQRIFALWEKPPLMVNIVERQKDI